MNNRPAFTISAWIRRSADQVNRTGLVGQNDLVEFGYIDNNTTHYWNNVSVSTQTSPYWITASANDGIVPTLSQVRGELVAAAFAMSFHRLLAGPSAPDRILALDPARVSARDVAEVRIGHEIRRGAVAGVALALSRSAASTTETSATTGATTRPTT